MDYLLGKSKKIFVIKYRENSVLAYYSKVCSSFCYGSDSCYLIIFNKYKEREMKYLIVLLTVILIAGCDNLKLSKVENASKSLHYCLAHQIIPDECDNAVKILKIAKLKSTQAGIDKKRIEASSDVGEALVSEKKTDSPFNRIKRSLESPPFYIKPNMDNFKPFLDNCSDFDISSLESAERFILNSNNIIKSVAYLTQENKTVFIFSRTAEPCLPDDYEDINNNFPFITMDQKEKLEAGVYLKRIRFPTYKSIEVIVFDTFDEAKSKYRELKDQV